MPEAQQDAGCNDRRRQASTGSPNLRPNPISLPKNRSTGNLHRDLSFTPLTADARLQTDLIEDAGLQERRSRYSVDGGTLSQRDAAILSPLMTESEHGFHSGLRRIRQGPPSRTASRAPSGTVSRTPTAPPSPESRYEPFMSRAASMNLHVSTERGFSMDAAGGGPALGNFGEDLQRFPSESLHSFSFAHQSEELLHNRISVLKKSLEFMRDRPGLAGGSQHPGLMLAQAKLNGDHELQDIITLLSKAHLLERESSHMFGAVTGPVQLDAENVFEKGFAARRSDSPDRMDEDAMLSPTMKPLPPSVTPQMRQLDEQLSPASDFSLTSGKLDDRSIRSISPRTREPTVHRSFSNPRPAFKRTVTDTRSLSLQTQLADVLARPYNTHDPSLDSALLSPTLIPPFIKAGLPPTTPGGTNHAAARWHPASQAIFTTGTSEPWTILAANDLACLVFGVTRAEIRKLGILEVIRRDRREWLKARLEAPGSEASVKARNSLAPKSRNPSAVTSSSLAIGKGGITAMLLSKPPARQQAAKRSQTEGAAARAGQRRGSAHETNRPRGVLLCGDIVPIQKRNGTTGSASLWVKEKKGYLIWVLEEIVEDSAVITLDETGKVISASGAIATIWSQRHIEHGIHVSKLLPKVPLTGPGRKSVDYGVLTEPCQYAARTQEGYGVPISVTANALLGELNVSSFPHMAGIIVLSADDMRITSSNSVFTTMLFGHKKPNGTHITDLIPSFVKLTDILTEDGQNQLGDGTVVPEHSFRRARAHLAFREDASRAAETLFLKPTGLPAKHADGSEIYVDVQMRVVKSDVYVPEEAIIEEREDEDLHERDEATDLSSSQQQADLVYALWVTYSRHLHSAGGGTKTPLVSRPSTPPRQPSPGQAIAIIDPPEGTIPADTAEVEQVLGENLAADESGAKKHAPSLSQIERDIKEATSQPISARSGKSVVEIRPEALPDSQPTSPEMKAVIKPQPVVAPPKKKTINDFDIIEDMGQGAYGQVKLARYKEPPCSKVVLKYVTKKRILVDTWMRDRKLGTVPSEIHVLNFLKKDGMRHPNIVEMIDFFEDKDYYYIMMVPHGLPGMDLFDYIEMRPSMEEGEVRNIFVQVANALHHLHENAQVVHRDIKDENIILDGENRVKLIDFGSAAYTRSGPFDVFVGTIDYAAPEVITGQSYRGKPQDIWALGILLYTLVYKENPFYNVDEILERDLRVPYIMSEGNIALIRAMLIREVDERYTIQQVLDHPWTKGEGEGVGRTVS